MRYNDPMKSRTYPTSFRLTEQTRTTLATMAEALTMSQTACLTMLIEDIGPIVVAAERDARERIKHDLLARKDIL